MEKGGKSTASTNERAADEKVESSAKRPKQALGKGGEKDIDQQSSGSSSSSPLSGNRDNPQGTNNVAPPLSEVEVNLEENRKEDDEELSAGAGGDEVEGGKKFIASANKRAADEKLNQVQRDKNRLWANKKRRT